MSAPKLIDRKLFLNWTVTTAGIAVVGCGEAADGTMGTGGMGGTGGSSGVGGSSGASGAMGSSGAGGSSGSSGAGGSAGATGGGGAGGAGGSGGGGSGGGGAGGGGAGGGGAGGGGSGGGGAGGAANQNCGMAGTQEFLSVYITADHDHALQVPVADVTAGVGKSYDTTGASGHPHWIYLTAADFTALANGETVIKYSCNDAHEHEFIISGMEGGMACDTPDIMTRNECFTAGNDVECGDVDGSFCDADEDDVLGDADMCPLEVGLPEDDGCPP